MHLGHGRGGSHLNEDDDGRGHADGSKRVENDAEGAVVGVGLKGMDVSHLNDGEQNHQGQAQQRHDHDFAWRDEAGVWA